jgi:alpha-L-fucosidase
MDSPEAFPANRSMIRFTLLALVLLASAATAPVAFAAEGPSALQQRLIDRGYGMFIHFGMNTFIETEWSDGTTPVEKYHPTHLDPDQWIETAKEAGFRYVILVTKHHDGFCLWDSQATDYDVAASTVTTDVVGEVAEACKRHGLELGIYYSLWDRHEPVHNDPDPQKYVAFMERQLTELLTNYGPICELWLDGGWAKPDADWDLPKLDSLVKRLQPNCLFACNHTIGRPEAISKIRLPEEYVAGDPIRFWPADFRLKDPDLARRDDPKSYRKPDGEMVYLPFEHTICLSDRWNWFQKREALPVRSLDELEELFYWGTANDNVLIVNVPPDETGRVRLHERQQVLALADRLGVRGGGPLPTAPIDQARHALVETAQPANETNPPSNAVDDSLTTCWEAAATDDALTLSPADGQRFTFDRIALHEQSEDERLPDGFSTLHHYRVGEYAIDAFIEGEWRVAYLGEEIGAAKVIRFPETIEADKVRLRFLGGSAPARIRHVSIGATSTIGRR